MCNLHDPQAATPTAFDANALVDELVVALSNARIYRPDHPRVTGAAEAVEAGLRLWFEASPEAERCEIGTADGFLFHKRRPLVGVSLSAVRLIEPLRTLGSGGISFQPGLKASEVLALVGLLAPRTLKARNLQEANAALLQQGASRVRLLPPYRHEGLALGTAAPLAETRETAELEAALLRALEATPRAVYQGTVELLQDAAIGAARGETIALDPARGVVERLQKRMIEDAPAMLGLSRYERYDEFTFGHSIRVCMLALQFGWALTQDEHKVQRLGVAALMHDIGKARVPFEILHAKRRLEPAEKDQIGRHTELGAEILLDAPDPDLLSVAVAFGHHRDPDGGGGYPRTADRGRLSVATRMIRICDVYEALTAVRPYKERMSPLRAYRIMMGMRGHFDTTLLRRFIQVNGAYPVGSLVELESGETGVVQRQTRDVLRPVVRIEEAPVEGVRRPGTELRDLSEQRPEEGWRVQRLVLEATPEVQVA